MRTRHRRGAALPALAIAALVLAAAGLVAYLIAGTMDDTKSDASAQTPTPEVSLGTGTGTELPSDWTCEEHENKAFAVRGAIRPSWDGTYTFRCQDDGDGGREPDFKQRFYRWEDGLTEGGPWEKAF